MDVILLERISRLGGIGDVVKVRNGFARNYLIPQKKALRASKENREVFEAQREALEAQNAEAKAQAQTQAETLEGAIVTVVRQASDDGKLYGSVAVRDVADALEAEGHKVDRRLIDLNTAIKNLGLYDVTVNLHPEVPVTIKVHVARNADSPLPKELYETGEGDSLAESEDRADAASGQGADAVTAAASDEASAASLDGAAQDDDADSEKASA